MAAATAASSQPIALPTTTNNDLDPPMGSYSGSYNQPSSYSKHFIGTPISWKAGSFTSRFYNGVSPNHLIGLDAFDLKCGKMSSSMESDRGSFITSLYERQEELCRNYACCGQTLTDMHALADHFEEAHIVPTNTFAQTHYIQQHPQDPSQPIPIVPPPNPLASSILTRTQTMPPCLPSYYQKDHLLLAVNAPTSGSPLSSFQTTGHFDPDDMELDADPALLSATTTSAPPTSASSISQTSPQLSPSPPETPIPTPSLPYPHALLPFPHFPSQPPSPHPSTQHPRLPSSHASSRAMTPEAPSSSGGYPFNGYAGYSDYSSSMPGTVPSPPSYDDVVGANTAASVACGVEVGTATGGNCVQPSALFSTAPPSATSPRTPSSTPAASRSSSPASSILQQRRQSAISAPSTTLSRPASTLLLSKPFRCPKTNCNKSYKQANGLKYHMTHGSCSLKPVKEVEAVKVLLASKAAAAAQQQAQASSSGSSQLNSSAPGSPATPGTPSEFEYAVDGVEVTQADLLMLEKRIRPFACGIGDCQRRYKNMNGLRYHYSHSGDHGKRGLELLAMGIHECLSNSLNGGNGKSRSGQSRGGSRVSSRAQTPPTPSSVTTAAVNPGTVYEEYESELKLQAPPLAPSLSSPPPLSSSSSSPPPLPQTTPGQYSFQGITYQTQSPHSPPPTPSAFTGFQTTSYALAGAMGPAATGAVGTYAGNRDVMMA